MSRSRWREYGVPIVTALITGGLAAMAVAYTQVQVQANELSGLNGRVDFNTRRIDSILESMGKVREDVAWIRGKLEGRAAGY